MFDRQQFLKDLDSFVRFKTCVDQNPIYFEQAREWLKGFFDPVTVTFIERSHNGFTNLLIKPKESRRPKLLGDGHIEVVPGEDQLFELREMDGLLYGRGVADMKTQCLMMVYVLRELIEHGQHNDFWLLFSEDEEIGSHHGVRRMVDYLEERDWLPGVVFVPDGGPDFAYVEKEKGMITFSAMVPGKAAHGSRPFLGRNAIERAFALDRRLQERFPNPTSEKDWIPSLSMTRIEAGEAFNKIPDRCRAGFDMRFTEDYAAEALLDEVARIAADFEADIEVHDAGTATYYPRQRPLARRYIDILRQVSGKEPAIEHTNGASNARFYAEKRPDTQILMINPTVVGLHAVGECLVADSLDPYYRLVHETALLL